MMNDFPGILMISYNQVISAINEVLRTQGEGDFYQRIADKIGLGQLTPITRFELKMICFSYLYQKPRGDHEIYRRIEI